MSLFRPSGLLADLPDRAEVIGQVGDAADHARQFDVARLSRRRQRLEPSLRLGAQAVADLLPLLLVDDADLPGGIPGGIGERIATLPRPAVHQRKSVAEVLGVCGDRRAAIQRA